MFIMGRKVMCIKCQVVFKSKLRYDQHMETHVRSEDRKWSCPECPSYFKQLNHLRTHQTRVHAGEKNGASQLPCSFCGKTFASSKLKSHEESHNAERHFKCPSKAERKEVLDKHKDTNHTLAIHVQDKEVCLAPSLNSSTDAPSIATTSEHSAKPVTPFRPVVSQEDNHLQVEREFDLSLPGPSLQMMSSDTIGHSYYQSEASTSIYEFDVDSGPMEIEFIAKQCRAAIFSPTIVPTQPQPASPQQNAGVPPNPCSINSSKSGNFHPKTGTGDNGQDDIDPLSTVSVEEKNLESNQGHGKELAIVSTNYLNNVHDPAEYFTAYKSLLHIFKDFASRDKLEIKRAFWSFFLTMYLKLIRNGHEKSSQLFLVKFLKYQDQKNIDFLFDAINKRKHVSSGQHGGIEFDGNITLSRTNYTTLNNLMKKTKILEGIITNDSIKIWVYDDTGPRTQSRTYQQCNCNTSISLSGDTPFDQSRQDLYRSSTYFSIPALNKINCHSMKKLIDIWVNCFGSDEQEKRATFSVISSDPHVVELLPAIVHLLKAAIPFHYGDTDKVMDALQLFSSLLKNCCLHQQMFLLINEICSIITQCAITDMLTLTFDKATQKCHPSRFKAEFENQYKVREFCAQLMSQIFKQFFEISNDVVEDIVASCIATLLDSTSLLTSRYGAISVIGKIGSDVVADNILPYMKQILKLVQEAEQQPFERESKQKLLDALKGHTDAAITDSTVKTNDYKDLINSVSMRGKSKRFTKPNSKYNY